MRLWYKDDPTQEELDRVVPLFNRIQKESYDWYNSKPVTEAAKKAHEKERTAKEKLRKLRPTSSAYKKALQEYNAAADETNGVVLRDLGFEDTKENRELIHHIIRWD